MSTRKDEGRENSKSVGVDWWEEQGCKNFYLSGSGKTYTMNGEPHNGGIMPRCIDVIFNTISNYQAKKYVFKPDKMNGFEIQDESDAVLCCQNDIGFCTPGPKSAKTPRR